MEAKTIIAIVLVVFIVGAAETYILRNNFYNLTVIFYSHK